MDGTDQRTSALRCLLDFSTALGFQTVMKRRYNERASFPIRIESLVILTSPVLLALYDTLRCRRLLASVQLFLDPRARTPI